MTDEDALLRAVIADPDDDAPRLIYADWLDENGRSERAEFIRVQIALDERLRGGTVEGVGELRRRQRRILRRFGKTWTEPLRPLVREHTFCRGFVESIGCSAEDFVRRGEGVFSLAPIRQLSLTGVRRGALLLSQCPHLNRPLDLDLSNNWLMERQVFYLANSQFFGRLTSLNLEDNRINTRGGDHLARSPFLGSLDDLYLRGNQIQETARIELRRRFGSRVHF